VFLAEIPDAEGAKRVEVAGVLLADPGPDGLHPVDAVIGMGGGATTDSPASSRPPGCADRRRADPHDRCWDGGLRQSAARPASTRGGKNLVGAFHMPRAVLCDLDMLDGLPKNEILAGYAEIAKAGFIAEPEILDIIEADVDAATDPATPQFRRAIELAIAMKARIVGRTSPSRGCREILNYGHTLGHAIEHAERYQWRHGACDLDRDGVRRRVVAAHALAQRRRRRPPPQHPDLLSLPTTYPSDAGRRCLPP
jgi:3-dehydroquinate synthase